MTVRGARIRWRRALLATVMVGASFTYVAATFVDLEDPLYTAKWLSCAAILVALLACARWHFATDHVYPFALVVAMVTLGLVAQIGDNIDMRAMQVAFGLTLTAVGAFLIAPPALQRRWVRATVWPALLLGVTAGLVAGMVLGLLHPERAFLIDAERFRFRGYFARVNSPGWYGFVGIALSAAATIATRRWLYLLAIPLCAIPAIVADSRGALLAVGTLASLWLIGLGVHVPWRWKLLGLAATTALFAYLAVFGGGGWPRLTDLSAADLDRVTS